MRRKRIRHADEAEINVTPMLDIVFIMLIFFIVTTSFVREFGVDVSRPASAPPQQADEVEVVAVRIDARGNVAVDGRPTDRGRVRALIEAALASRPQASVVVVTSREAAAEVLVGVVDAARAAGAQRVAVAEAPR